MYRNSPYLRLKKFWLEHDWLGPLLIFIIAAAAFTIWISEPTFRDPDSFYHLKISEMMIKKRMAIVDFPWLQFTTLKDAYVDHHFLYHVFLIPFILAFDSIVGIKLATVMLATSTVTLFYFMLRSFRIKYAFFFSLALLFTSAFAFRMSLSKAPSFAFLFVMGGFYLMAKKRHKLLFLLSFFFVWSYGGFLLLPIIAIAYSSLHIIKDIINNSRWPNFKKIKNHSQPAVVSTVGTVAGLLIHPSFPQHLQFYWQQVIQIGLLNYKGLIDVGGEWSAVVFPDLVTFSLLSSSLLIIGLFAFIITLKKQTLLSITAFVMTVIFFLFTLKSHRYVEYYVPWSYLFAALALSASGILDKIPEIVTKAYQASFKNTVTAAAGLVAVVYILFIIPGLMIYGAKETYTALQGGIPITDFAKAGRWLRNHSTKGDVVFNSNWDIFPQLFYHAARTRFIVGLDPTFMYNYDQALYWKWYDITTGKKSDNLLEIIQDDFGARFIVIENDNTKMMDNVIEDGHFKMTYGDDDYTIFRVPRPNQPTTQTAN